MFYELGFFIFLCYAHQSLVIPHVHHHFVKKLNLTFMDQYSQTAYKLKKINKKKKINKNKKKYRKSIQ